MSATKEVTFVVPELAQRPILGGGCCAAASAWLIQVELEQRPGILEVEADDRRGEVAVVYDPAATSISAIWNQLAELDFSPVGSIHELIPNTRSLEGRGQSLP